MRGMESLKGQRNKDDLVWSLGESSFLYQSRFFSVAKKKIVVEEEDRKEGRKKVRRWVGRKIISLSSRGSLASGAA